MCILNKFIGRTRQLQQLESLWSSPQSQLVVVYGRRRIGKSKMLEHFCEGKIHFQFEALERRQKKEQVEHFLDQLKKQYPHKILEHTQATNWKEALDLFTVVLEESSTRKVVVFDEFQWMASQRTELVSLLKFYWDKFWKNKNVMLILCGSIASFMVNKVLKSKALYGRFNYDLKLKGLEPREVLQMLKLKRSPEEALLYQLILGGVPKYLELIDVRRSFDQNINRLLFVANGVLLNELERIFYSQFKDHQIYTKIVKLLSQGPMSLDEISKKLKIPSGGGLKSYLDNLILADFAQDQVPFGKKINSKLKKYKLRDEYLSFYFKFVEPHLGLIQKNDGNKDLFSRLVKPTWKPWVGLAFENFCLKNALFLAEKMGFEDYVEDFGSYSGLSTQIDLIFKRTDKVIVLCEVKFHEQALTTSLIPEMEKKIKNFEVPKGYTLEKALISLHGADKSLLNSEYFHHVLSIEDIFSE